MFRKILNLSTGEESQISLTEEEITDLQNAPQPVAPIRSIDARRLRLALLQLNLLDDVESAITTLGRAAQIEWEYATTIKENYPLVEALATNLGLDTDAIFTLASSLE